MATDLVKCGKCGKLLLGFANSGCLNCAGKDSPYGFGVPSIIAPSGALEADRMMRSASLAAQLDAQVSANFAMQRAIRSLQDDEQAHLARIAELEAEVVELRMLYYKERAAALVGNRVVNKAWESRIEEPPVTTYDPAKSPPNRPPVIEPVGRAFSMPAFRDGPQTYEVD